ncbi:metallophosphoesterase family protein [Algoriphagus sediminis]|uniref:Metallophosphoesterase n=1 Tax=Algoriphagus sediminis TaxID=3057113 RepID=A0ABT7YGE3_9BACT|nr:metallophosphoesterase [Algoriphagus sediminis]MDN3205593.1 metallophosphoesterase [Algoriphagus sediminis]
MKQEEHPDITRQVNIIHLSDLHFGDTHRFKIPASTDGDVPLEKDYPTLIEKLSLDLNEIDHNCPTIICLTGDFVDTGNVNEFALAEKFIKDLLLVDSLKHLSMKDVFVVPGNHDVNYKEEDLGLRFQQYIEFYNRIYNTSIKREEPFKCQMVHNFSKDKGYIIACLNSSTYVQKGTQDEKRGRISISDIENLIKELESIDSNDLNNSIKIALIHHHPVLIPALAESARGYDAVHNSEKLLTELKKFGFHIVLHGHKHDPHTFTEDIIPAYKNNKDIPMMIVSGGSIGSKELPNNPNCINSYNKITVKWHPKGEQSRIRIETRGLRMYDTDNNLMIPTRWNWELMKIDDRHFFAKNNTPVIANNYTARNFQEADEEEDKLRIKQYEESRGNLPVLKVLPSLVNNQAYEAIIWIVQHRYGEKKLDKDIPTKVIYTAGKRFKVIEVTRQENKHFTAKLTYWGPMLIQCKMFFEDGHIFRTHLYARMPNQY